MELNIRPATKADFEILFSVEQSFCDFQRSSAASIKRSLKSTSQQVFIAEEKNKTKTPVGVAILFKYKQTLRIYSIAVFQQFRGMGYGNLLLEFVMNFAYENNYTRLSLEVDAQNKSLVKWYQSKGFVALFRLDDYYKPGKNALKMELKSTEYGKRKSSNVIVINQPIKWQLEEVNAKVISVKEYINNSYYQNSDLRIFNLCNNYKYQSYGYYVSLMASARGQRCVPGSITIQDFNLTKVIHSAVYDVENIIEKVLSKIAANNLCLKVYFGQTIEEAYSDLALKLYQLFEAPLFEVNFVKHEKWMIKDMKVLTFHKVSKADLPYFYQFAQTYFNKKRFSKTRLKNYKYDLAVLINPQEETPPSCSKALMKLKDAAEKRGVYVELITKSDFNRINEFDALFIRETTALNNHTYEFSRMAYAEGLVVIDDPWSIMKCSNKIFQNEIFRKNKIRTPKTVVFTKNLFKAEMLMHINYPVVLKQPDSAFSLGVTKVENAEETASALLHLFKKSDMVICQEFLYSDFDWRIGVLDNKPLFACKYYMTKGHWQIYNWKENGDMESSSGDSETIPVESVPQIVVETAVKAASIIGDGLYGVDLKLIDDKVYVIEVNDNPNIDADVEDLVLKDTLYEMLVDSIYNRIELSKNIRKLDFIQIKN